MENIERDMDVDLHCLKSIDTSRKHKQELNNKVESS